MMMTGEGLVAHREDQKSNRVFDVIQGLLLGERADGPVRARQPTLLLYLCAFVIAASLTLGGGTRGGFLSDAILQLLAIPLLLVAFWKLFELGAFWKLFEFPVTKQMQIPLLFCLALVLIPIVQLIPLPPWLWTALPGREPSVETFEILGQTIPWMPLSVSPHETWLSALSLIPPLGIFLATLQLPYRDRRWLTWVFLAVGVVSVFIGMIQVAQGPESAWRFFEFTNDTEAVGFFANRNHFAALLYALTLFAAAWAVNATTLGQAEIRQKYDTVLIVAAIGAFTLLVVLLAGQMMARSRMGLGLSILALFGALALGVSDRRIGSSVTPIKLMVGAIVLALVFAFQFALYRVMERFAVDPLEDSRLPFGRNTVEAALSYLPFGSGLGTFVPVYAMFEKPEDTIMNAYANRAHNDFLELWLNTGIVGPALAGMFVAWLGLRSLEIWRNSPPRGASDLDWDLVRSATLVVGLLVAHSLVDYPLRTGAIMAVMAFACALLIEPPPGSEPLPRQSLPTTPMPAAPKKTRLPEMPMPTAPKKTQLPEMRERQVMRLRARLLRKAAPPAIPLVPEPSPAPAVPTPTSAPASSWSSESGSLSPDQRWGMDVDWPEEWSKSSKSSSASGSEAPPDVPKPPKGS
jgi:O-antigen ligase